MLRGCAIAIITPMPHASTIGQVQAPGPTPSAPKQLKSDVYSKSKSPVRARLSPTFEKEKLIQRAVI